MSEYIDKINLSADASVDKLISELSAEYISKMPTADTFIQVLLSLIIRVDKEKLIGSKKRDVVLTVFSKLIRQNPSDQLLNQLLEKKIIAEILDTLLFVSRYRNRIGINKDKKDVPEKEKKGGIANVFVSIGKFIENLSGK